MNQINNEDAVIVNKFGYPELELLANSVNTTKMGREYIVSELVAAGFNTVKSIASKSVPETIFLCPELKDLMPGLHEYALNLQAIGF